MYKVYRQEDVELSEDKKTLKIYLGYDGNNGYMYVDVPIKFVKKAIASQENKEF